MTALSIDFDERMAFLRNHGYGSLAYSSLQTGVTYMKEGELGYVPYALSGVVDNKTPICLADPICAHEDVSQLLSAFMRQFRTPVFIHISRTTAEKLARLGFFVNEFGVETIIDVCDFDLKGEKKQYLRSQRNRAKADGVTVVEVDSGTVDAACLKEVSDRWMQSKAVRSNELSFLVRPAVYGHEVDVRKFVALREGHIIGFVFFDPMYCCGKVKGYIANIVRSLSDRSYSVTDYIILEALEQFKKEGIQELSLGLSPFAQIEDDGSLPYSKRVKVLFQALYDKANFLYSFQALAFHKRRWRPDVPGCREMKVYCAARSAFPLLALYAVFRCIGIRPFRQTGAYLMEKCKLYLSDALTAIRLPIAVRRDDALELEPVPVDAQV